MMLSANTSWLMPDVVLVYPYVQTIARNDINIFLYGKETCTLVLEPLPPTMITS